ncbi:C-C motif chemokine 17-like [Elgaria multicarinata webbii]|uniref:C-C motif chemokine 17-like n=1 Tax=Elgaria multicarinata webbii TaxID=159646 RepID=UPI002FCD18C5
MASLKPALLLALLLAISYQLVAASPPTVPRECCFSVKKGRPLPIRDIVSYYWTPSECYLRAVVFVMKRGSMVCLDPDTRWVRSAIRRLPEKNQK